MPSILTTLAEKARSHHSSVNAAYATYYGSTTTSPSVSPRRSIETAPQQLPPSTLSSTAERKSSSTSSSSDTPLWTKVKKAAREHHDGLNAAYATHYGAGYSSASTPVSSPRMSGEESRGLDAGIENASVKGEKKGKSVWGKVKKAAREHHRSVNNAVEVYYG